MNKFFLFLLFFSLCSSAYAQKWSLGAEYGIIRTYGRATSQGDVFKVPGRGGSQFGLKVTYHSKNDFFFRAGIMKAYYWYMQGFEIPDDKFYANSVNSINYGLAHGLFRPVFFSFDFGKRFWLQKKVFAVSPYLGLSYQKNLLRDGMAYRNLLESYISGGVLVEEHENNFVRNSNIALQAGVALEAYFWKRFCFTINYEFMKGLLIQTEGWGKISYDEEILEYGTCKSYSDKMSLSFGLRYTLKKE